MARRVVGIAAAAAVMGLLIGGGAAARSPAPEPDASGKFPRFESLRANKVFMRTGPGEQYPVEWVFLRRDMPLEVIVSVEHWRKVKDWQGAIGWVHQKMLWPHRDAMVTGAVRALRASPAPNAAIVARAEPGVIGKLVECQGAWCRIEAGDYGGWLMRGEIFGVEPTETYP
ncbi:MAG TPA: SH3 domain-containing protein [Stellaceae bacterium]|nr:SH3 domain-containing protein [Stellaceae bacterium]